MPELSDVLASGDIGAINKGGALASDAVQDTGEIDTIVQVERDRLTVLETTGLVVMSGNSLVAQSIGVTPTKVILFDTKQVEAGVGVSGDIALQRATATLAGVFKLRFEAFVDYASNVDITWSMYKNGSQFGNTITLSGQGANVFPITLITSANLLANDYLELYATASATTNLTVSQANGTLEKTIF